MSGINGDNFDDAFRIEPIATPPTGYYYVSGPVDGQRSDYSTIPDGDRVLMGGSAYGDGWHVYEAIGGLLIYCGRYLGRTSQFRWR